MLIFLIIVAYLFGSIPFGLLIAKSRGFDIRSVGSRNIGATNVARVMGKKYAALTFVLDGLKGFIPTLIASFYYGSDSFSAGIVATVAVLGHIFPIFLKFKGGKGVATTIMTYFALNNTIGLSVVLTWLSVFIVTKYSSLSAILAILIGVIFSFITNDVGITIFAMITSSIILFKHIPNIKRLISGQETKIQ